MIDGVVTAWRKKTKSKELKAEFNANCTRKELVILVTIPDISAHAYHITGGAALHFQPLDSEVINFIHKLALDGHRNVPAIQLLVKEFVNTLNVNGDEAEGSRFRPTKENIRNHVYKAIVASNLQSAHDDQMQVCKAVCRWQSSNPEDNFFFRPASKNEESGLNSMLFVAQTKFQRELLLKYGAEITLMDSTYKVTKYDIPLYQLCVRTNVGFAIVASFFVSRDCKQQITEALQMIKDWNATWSPSHFMCDFDLREIGALETIFQGSQVLLCDFHRDQAWQRWLSNKHHGMQNVKETILKQLRKIAGAASEEEFETDVSEIRSCSAYQENATFKNWLEKKWLQDCKRWVFCFRRDLSNLIKTTNGIEVQHRVFKHAYLKEFGVGKSLLNVTTVLVCNFLPDAERNYITRNVKGMSSVRQYSKDIPEFLKNRPRKFVEHCLERIPPIVDEVPVIEEITPSTFKVKSFKGNQSYFITVENEIPECTCKDFINLNWPCKHILAICLRDGIKFISRYMDQVHFVLDSYSFLANEEYSEGTGDTFITCSQVANTDQSKCEESGESKIRKMCLEHLNELQNGLYMTDDINVLKTMDIKITELNEYIRKNVPCVAGLPTGSKRKGWQRKALNNYHSRKRRKVPEQIKVTSSEQIEKNDANTEPINLNRTSEILKSAKEVIQQGKFQEALTLLWTAQDSDDLVGTVGPYNLDCNSFQYLKTRLSDEVIDAYLHTLCQQYQQCLHISSVVMTAIFNGQANIHSLLRRQNIFQHEYCIGAVNEGACHWILMIVRPKERQIIYLNPLGEVDNLKQRVLQQWYAFLQGRWKAKIDKNIPDKWILHCPTHSRQIDGLSCGVYVLKFAENYLRKKSLTLKWTKKDLEKERRNIGVHLLSAATISRGAVRDRIPAENIEETGNLDVTVEEEITDYTENVEAKEIEEFEPTPWFQPVKKGGLCYKIDLQTGETLAKLIEGTKGYRQWEEKQRNNSYCEPVTKTCEEKPLQVEKPLEHEEESEEPDEESFFIDKEIASKNIDVAFTRVENIIKLKEKKKFWMKRHYQFQNFRRVVCKGYGYAIFSTQAILVLKEKLTKRFFTDVTRKIYTKHGRIIGMEDQEMNKLFEEDRFLAYVYLMDVLVTEALAAILQHHAGLTYKKADEECRAVEGFKLEAHALKAGLILSSEKKKELMQKMK